MDFKTFLCEQERDTGIAKITFNNPEKLNPISEVFVEELGQALQLLAESKEVRVVVMTGAGRAFSAGGDLAEIQEGFGGTAGFLQHMELVNRGTAKVILFPKPLIAAVNGPAIGAGMNLALAADIIIAAETAKFAEIFGQIGLCVDVAGTYLLPRLVGRAKAKELVFTYETIGADVALEYGIVNQVVAPEELERTVREWAEKIASGPTFAFQLAKKLINRSTETDLQTMLDLEGMAQALCAATEDHEEGLDAFFNKRKPTFKGE